jgi:large subunit ribosomal protein L6e
MPRYYLTKDVRRKLLAKNLSVSMWGSCVQASHPGTILIILTGRNRGKRVVFLMQLSSGLLLVTGHLSLNWVPLCCIEQTRNLSSAAWKSPNTLLTLQEEAEEAQAPGRRGLRHREKEKYEITEQSKIDQKTVDRQILPKIKAIPQLQGYMRSVFALTNGR